MTESLPPTQASHTLPTDDGTAIAVVSCPGKSPAVLFLGGFRSSMAGEKAQALDGWCRERGQAFVRFDYRGHGQSGGTFADYGIDQWRDDALAVLDALVPGPVILVGSSMGVWIACLVALARPDRAKGLIGIAGAPDFTEHLIWNRMTEEQRNEMVRTGRLMRPSRYSDEPDILTQHLVESGRRCQILAQAIPIDGPVRLLHGVADPDVPWTLSTGLMACVATDDVRLTLVKDGDHRLSRPQDIAVILRDLDEVLSTS